MTQWIGYFGLLLLALLWGTMVPAVAHLLGTWDPYFLAAIRYIGAVPLMWTTLLLLERRRPVVLADGSGPVSGPRIWLLGVIGIGCYSALFTVGIHFCHPVTAAILSATSPAVAAIVDRVIFGIPINRRMLPAIVLAILGCAIATVRLNEAGRGFDFRGGELLIVLAFACWSWYSTAAQRWCRGWSQLRITTSTMTTGGVALAVIYLVAGVAGAAPFPPALPASADDVLILAWVTIVLVALGVYLWNFGVKRTGVVVASLYLNLVPVVAIGIFALAGTAPSWPQLMGGVLVIAGVVMSELQLLKARKSDPALNAAQPS
ncbi:MAG: EamA family transporter [Rhodospirillaceae bacterium]|nr:EamA family transporter [Rhodospirillaceae bacterium]